MILNKNNFLKLSIIILSISIFIGYLIGNLYIILFFSFITVIISHILLKSKYLYINYNDKLWFICLFITSLSLIYSKDKSESINFIFMLICGLGIKILYQNLSGWQNFLIKIFYIFSSIHVIATIIQKIFPNIITSVYSKILPYSILETNIMFLKIDNYSGITGQTGVNAFYISIFLAIVFSKFLFEKQKVYINVFFIVLGFYALILTGKRGLLISNIICFFIIILIMKKKKRKNLSKIVLAIISFIIASIVIYNSNDMKVILLKFKLLEQSGDITNGRSIIWSLAIENFKNNFFLGTGISSTAKIIGEYAHNIYIQLLSDLGILGFLSFVFTFIFSLIFSIKLFRSIYNTIKISDDILRNIAISIYIQILFIIYGFTGNPLYGVMFFIPYLINIALIYTYKYELKGEEY